jgi:hypothetical protein
MRARLGRSSGTPLQRGALAPLPPGTLARPRAHGPARSPGLRARAPAPHSFWHTGPRESSTFTFARLAGPEGAQNLRRDVSGLPGRFGSQLTASAAHRSSRIPMIQIGVSGECRGIIYGERCAQGLMRRLVLRIRVDLTRGTLVLDGAPAQPRQRVPRGPRSSVLPGSANR